MESSVLLCVRHRMKNSLHFPKCSCTQLSCEMQKTVTRARVLRARRGSCKHYGKPTRAKQRQPPAHLPHGCCDYGPIARYRSPRSPIFPVSSSAHTPPVPARSAGAGWGAAKVWLESSLASTRGYSVCLLLRTATPSCPSPQVRSSEKASCVTLVLLSGTGKALVLSATPPEVRQLRKLIQDHMHQCPPPGWKKACPTAGKRTGSITQILGMSAAAPLGCPALPVASSETSLPLIAGAWPALKQQGPATAWYGVRSAWLLTVGFLGLCWDD